MWLPALKNINGAVVQGGSFDPRAFSTFGQFFQVVIYWTMVSAGYAFS